MSLAPTAEETATTLGNPAQNPQSYKVSTGRCRSRYVLEPGDAAGRALQLLAWRRLRDGKRTRWDIPASAWRGH